MGDKLFADLPVNAVTSVTIADSEDRVVLVKGDKVWQVDGRSGYPADFDQLRELVVKLSRLKIGRSFPASTESLTRLSLMPPSTADTSSTGKQITLTDASGKILADVILGQSRETDSEKGGGQYLKKGRCRHRLSRGRQFPVPENSTGPVVEQRDPGCQRRGREMGRLLCRRPPGTRSIPCCVRREEKWPR